MHSFFSCCCHCRISSLADHHAEFRRLSGSSDKHARVHLPCPNQRDDGDLLQNAPVCDTSSNVETEGLHKLCVSSATVAIICCFQKRRRALGQERSCLCVRPFASCSPDAGLASRSKGVPQTPACHSRSGDTLWRRIRWCPGRNLDNN